MMENEDRGNVLEHVELEVFMCAYCTYQSRRLNRYLSHLRYIHQHENGFSVRCGVNGCQKHYSVVESLVRHLKRSHNFAHLDEAAVAVDGFIDDVGLDGHVNQQRPDEENMHEGNEEHLGLGLNQEFEENVDEGHDRVHFNYTRAIALFVLKLREEKKLPANACSDVVCELSELFTLQSVEIRESVIRVLNRNGIEPGTIDGFEEILSPFDRVFQACSNLKTQQKQNKFFAQNFEFVEPEEILLGHDENGKPETYMYIPIKKLLQALLKHDDVFAEVVNGHASPDGRLRDYCDGQAFRQNHAFSMNETTLQINLYTDDFQVVNPLGTKIKKYKLAAFYFVLGNIQPQYRSKLELIQLLILCRSELMQKYGMSVVLDRLVSDLLSLETLGFVVMNEGMEYIFHAVVAFLCADNLAAHSMSGLFESFSANRSCRFCMATKEERQEMFSDSECTLRTKDAHAVQLATVLQFPQLAPVYGMKNNSPFDRLQHFNPIWGCPSDVAHDLFEGFVPGALERVTVHFVQQQYFTLPQLNRKMKTFEYAICDRANKPTIFYDELTKFRVKQTAAQCWCLLRFLPLIVSEWVPKDDACLALLVDLLDIVDFVCAPSILPGEVHFLSDMITHFLEMYFTQFDVSVTPKSHFLTHYGRQKLHFGPLIHCWTMRFEGKHNYFKELANRTKNRKNICKSLAYRHQYQQCLYHTSQHFIRGNDNIQTVHGSLFPVRLLDSTVQDLLIPVLGGNENVYQATSVTINGVQYPVGCCVAHSFENDTYTFAYIRCIFVVGGMEYLLTEVMKTEEFLREVHGYSVSLTGTLKLCRVSNLLDYQPLGVYSLHDAGLVVILKHKIAT